MFRALPIEGHKNIIQPAIFGVSRWLPFEGEKRNLSKWLSFDPSRCLPDGREIFKIIHKNRVFMLYPLGEKIIFEKTLYFSRSRAPPLEGIFRKFRKPFIKSAFSCSTTWGRKIFTAKARFLIILVAYLLREEKYIFSKGLIFSLSRDLPLEGRKFFWEWLPKRPLSVGISEEKIIPWNPHISNFLAGYSLGNKTFLKAPTKTASPSRNK